jgi:hypothetical protein
MDKSGTIYGVNTGDGTGSASSGTVFAFIP